MTSRRWHLRRSKGMGQEQAQAADTFRMDSTTYSGNYPHMSLSLGLIKSVSIDLTAVTSQQLLAIAAAIAIVVIVGCGALIVLGWGFARCSRAQRHDITSLVDVVVSGLGRRRP